MPDTLLAPRASGYTLYDPSDPFEDYVGPIWYRRQDDGVHCLMPTEERHTNGGGALHGGVLLTFADYALCSAASFAASGGQMPGSFAMTLNLNAGEYEGGELRFPEYGPHLYSPGRGEAIVFSCSLVHEALDVTRGDRYVLLAFLYGEDGARQKREMQRRMQEAGRS